jgi:hypothetical protein
MESYELNLKTLDGDCSSKLSFESESSGMSIHAALCSGQN